MQKQKIYSRTVVLLSLVSLFNDISSEMLIPVLPIYLSSIGFAAFYIGVLEGLAEAVSGISKAYFGKLSDRLQLRSPFVRTGYALSAVSKSMMALFTFPWWVLFSRSMDRLGKGIRTAARDALLADESDPAHRGKVFGLNKALDTAGAMIGATVALLYLVAFPSDYRELFFIAFIPGMIAVVLTLVIRERKKQIAASGSREGVFAFLKYWKKSSAGYKRIVTGLLLFALFNSSDAFIFLVGKHCGLSDTLVLSAYIFYNLAFALLALPFGQLADRYGMKATFLTGLLFFVASYLIFPLSTTGSIYFAAFFLYAFFAAGTDGISKAWISRHCDMQEKATALGFYSGFHSLAILISNLLAGLLWSAASPMVLFYVSSGGALLCGFYFIFYSPVENVGSSTKSGFSAKK